MFDDDVKVDDVVASAANDDDGVNVDNDNTVKEVWVWKDGKIN